MAGFKESAALKTHTQQLADTLLEVQQECERLRRENVRLQAELEYAIGWIAKLEEAVEKR